MCLTDFNFLWFPIDRLRSAGNPMQQPLETFFVHRCFQFTLTTKALSSAPTSNILKVGYLGQHVSSLAVVLKNIFTIAHGFFCFLLAFFEILLFDMRNNTRKMALALRTSLQQDVWVFRLSQWDFLCVKTLMIFISINYSGFDISIFLVLNYFLILI